MGFERALPGTPRPRRRRRRTNFRPEGRSSGGSRSNRRAAHRCPLPEIRHSSAEAEMAVPAREGAAADLVPPVKPSPEKRGLARIMRQGWNRQIRPVTD